MRYFKFVGIVLLVLCVAGPLGASTVQAEETVHIVQRGENLYRIALQYGSTINAIAAANGISNPSLIFVGQKLIIPAVGSTPKAPTPPIPSSPTNSPTQPLTGGYVYTIKRGDTLFSIATRHQTTVAALAALNNIANPSLIFVGQQIAIPDGAAVPSTTPVQPPTASPPTTGDETQPDSNSFQFNHINVLRNPDNGVANIDLEWSPYPGAIWYYVRATAPATGAFAEYMLKGDLGMHLPASDLTVGDYVIEVTPMDEDQKPLSQSVASGSFSVDVISSYLPPDWAILNRETTTSPGGTVCPAPSAGGSNAQTILSYVNYERCVRDLPALSLNGALNTAAVWHSQDMAARGFFSHNAPAPAPYGVTPWDRMSNAGYAGTPRAENIAAGSSSPVGTFNQWWGSPGHRANILGNYGANGEMGLGYAAGGAYGHYWTQTFGQP